jgi:hypothetical protein
MGPMGLMGPMSNEVFNLGIRLRNLCDRLFKPSVLLSSRRGALPCAPLTPGFWLLAPLFCVLCARPRRYAKRYGRGLFAAIHPLSSSSGQFCFRIHFEHPLPG